MSLRIMFMANAPWCTTGYGVQGKHLLPRLRMLGHESAYFAFYGLQNGMLNFDGYPIYPQGVRMWGEDILPAHMAHFRADVLITLMDVWVQDSFGQMARERGWHWLPWLPIDQEPAPDAVLERLDGATLVLPYSRFGEGELRRAGLENVRYVPHGFAPENFYPGDRAEARRKLNLPADAFIIGMVAANKGYPSRKCFPEQLMAFARFRKRHPNAVMYLHTMRTTAHGGIDFDLLLRKLGLSEEAVIFADQYRYVTGYPERAMGDVYRALDCLSLTSMGEGFGVPLIEAQACGVPVITANNTAMPELTFGGYVVPRGEPMWTPLGGWAYVPHVDDIVEAYERMYEALQGDGDRAQLQRAALKGVAPFAWPRVIEDYWAPVLAEVEALISADKRN